MNVEVLNVGQRRLAIQRALQHYFHGARLDQVVGYWEQEYSAKPAFVLNRFLSEICTTEELKQNRKEMLKQVLYELTIIEKDELLQTNTKAQTVNVSAQYHAYIDFVAEVLHAVLEQDTDDFFDTLKMQLLRDRILLNDSSAMYNTTLAMMDRAQAKDYAKAITSLYQVLCEFYGPQRSDQVFAQARLMIKAKYPEADLHQLL